MKRDFIDYIVDILDSIQKTESFIDGLTFDKFKEDDKTIFAIIRALEIMGEASKNIPASVKQKHPEIPWKAMAGMRDKMVHEYFGVDLEIVWKTVKERIPTLKPLFLDLRRIYEK